MSHPAQICASLARDNRQKGACVPYHAYAQHVMCEKKQRTTTTRAWRHLPSKLKRQENVQKARSIKTVDHSIIRYIKYTPVQNVAYGGRNGF